MPKPPNLMPSSVRHKFVNFSVASLPTNCATCDKLTEQDLENADDDGSNKSVDNLSDDDSGFDESDNDDEVAASTPSEERRAGFATLAALVEGDRAAAQAKEFGSRLTTELAPDDMSERDELDLDPDVFPDSVPGQPLLDLKAGLQPRSELPRYPPAVWLVAAGFQVPDGRVFEHSPVAPVCGERPTKYLNLFARQMLARQRTSQLSFGTLAIHNRGQTANRHSEAGPWLREREKLHGKALAENPGEVLAQNGAWLESFIASARAKPLHSLTDQLVGNDLGANIAKYLDRLSMSNASAQLDDQDVPDGTGVVGQKMVFRPVHRGRGRSGFCVENEASISTPGRSQSPPPRPDRALGRIELPTPPLILPPGEERNRQPRHRMRTLQMPF